MTQSVAPDQIDVFVTVRLLNDSDGTPAESVVAATAGHQIWYRRDAAAVVTDGTSAADLASLTTAHTDWQFLHIRDGYYTVAYPDAAFASGVGNVLCGMDATGISCVAESVIIDKLLKFQGKASSVTATTTTFPTGTTPKQGDVIYVIDGTGERQSRLVTSATGEVATHLAWDVNISATTSTIVLIPGDETLGDGGINVDVLLSTRATPAQVQTELGIYDGPTRAEATADKDEILDKSTTLINTTIATLATQTSFTLTAGSADDDAYNNCQIIIIDAATATQKAVGWIEDYVGATKTVTLKADPGIFTMAVTDKVIISAINADVQAANRTKVIGIGSAVDKWRGP